MTLRQWLELGYIHFGRRAMRAFDKFVLGKINFETCVKKMSKEYQKRLSARVRENLKKEKTNENS